MRAYKIDIIKLDTLEILELERYEAENATIAKYNFLKKARNYGFIKKGDKYEVKIWAVK